MKARQVALLVGLLLVSSLCQLDRVLPFVLAKSIKSAKALRRIAAPPTFGRERVAPKIASCRVVGCAADRVATNPKELLGGRDRVV